MPTWAWVVGSFTAGFVFLVVLAAIGGLEKAKPQEPPAANHEQKAASEPMASHVASSESE